jgi:4-hydroxy-3-polyprenylbenzoate decarboxylase
MRFLVCMSGASGSIYGLRLITILGELEHEIHFIASKLAKEILIHEMGVSYEAIREKIEVDYDNDDLFAAPASGSFQVEGMVILPCSMKTLSAVATGYGDTLISRAALCQLKEGRPLILVVRETPVDLVGLRNMVAAREAGAVILPANPGFYHGPKSIEDLVDFIVGKVLDQLKVPHSMKVRWEPSGT